MMVVTWTNTRGAKLHLCAEHSTAYESGTLPQRYASGEAICRVSHGLHDGPPCDVCYPDRDPTTGHPVEVPRG